MLDFLKKPLYNTCINWKIKRKVKFVYTVTYNYYNYASQSKSFDTYVAAKGFFNRINRDRRVRRVELIAPEK